MWPVSQCEVLRCGNPVSRMLLLIPLEAGAGRLETGVCTEHGRLIDAGRPWRWEPDDPAMGAPSVFSGHLVMGDDFDSRHVTVIAPPSRATRGLTRAPDGSEALTVYVERLRGDGSTELLPILMGLETAQRVIDRLCQYVGRAQCGHRHGPQSDVAPAP